MCTRTEQVAQKKFLAALTGLVSSPTSTPAVKLMVFRVLSPLAYETRHDSDLSSITHAYDALLADPKTRPTPETVGEEGYDPALFPPHGAPLDPEDPLLRPEALLSAGGGGRSSTRPQRPRGAERFPTGLEQMQDLRKRAVEGRGYAAMLTDAVIHAEEEEDKERKRRSAQGLPPVVVQPPAAAASGDDQDGHEREVRTGLEANEVVQVRARGSFFCSLSRSLARTLIKLIPATTNLDAQEIHAKLLEVQDFLTSNLEWAAAQAAQSRARADAEQSSNTAQTPAPAPAAQGQGQGQGQGQADVHLASNNPFAAVLSGEVPISALTEESTKSTTTEEEDILSEILTATPEVRLLSRLFVSHQMYY